MYSRSSRYVAERTWVPLAVAAEVSFFLALVLLNEAINLVNTIIQFTGEVVQHEIPTFKVVLVGKFCKFDPSWRLLNNEPEKSVCRIFLN